MNPNWSRVSRDMRAFLQFRAPGLVFSATYLRGSLAPSALSRKRDLRFPPLISREKTAPSHQSLQKSTHIPSIDRMEQHCDHLQ